MNLNLYGHDGQWLMVDCGITFRGEGEPGPHIQMPDPAFIEQHQDRLLALLITHAHEDHVGAVAHLWRRFQCPVYCTAFTAEILRGKLPERGLLNDVPVHIISAGAQQQLGGFDVQWVELTHSTPETNALVITTPAGRIFHTADWKLDPDPVLGAALSPADLQAFANPPIDAVVCDSTNAMEPGRSISEGALHEHLTNVVATAPGRVIAACFGSNVARLHTLATVGSSTRRYCALLGRSLHNYHRAAVAAKIWRGPQMIDPKHLGYLPPEEVFAIATGSQGEPRAALERLAAGTHPALELDAGDMVVMSARAIPGNEPQVERLIRRLEGQGVTVVTDSRANQPLHASGHPNQDELTDMYQWLKPTLAIPVHGEAAHMDANAAVAKAAGVRSRLVGRNGDLFIIAPQRGIRRSVVPTGRLGLNDNGSVSAITA